MSEMLAEALAGRLTTAGEQTVLLSERQRGAIREACGAVQRAVALSRTAVQTIDCADVLAFELREALDALGAVLGEVTTEDLLTEIFSKFCIGK